MKMLSLNYKLLYLKVNIANHDLHPFKTLNWRYIQDHLYNQAFISTHFICILMNTKNKVIIINNQMQYCNHHNWTTKSIQIIYRVERTWPSAKNLLKITSSSQKAVCVFRSSSNHIVYYYYIQLFSYSYRMYLIWHCI